MLSAGHVRPRLTAREGEGQRQPGTLSPNLPCSALDNLMCIYVELSCQGKGDQMPNVTIYLPETLADEVKAARLAVSPICQEALKREVERMQLATTAKDDVKAAARRLRAARGEEENATVERGRAAGRAWALQRAMPSELESACELASEWWLSIGVPDEGVPDAWPTLYEELATVTPGVDPDERYPIERTTFMVAFFESAADAYRQILEADRALDEA